MSLTKKINELMTFALPTDWQETDFSCEEAESAMDELYASLTEEGLAAISPYRRRSPEDEERDRELFPDQYSAHACWNTEESSASISIYANIVFYTKTELNETDVLLSGRKRLEAREVAGSDLPVFSMFYSTRELPPELSEPSAPEILPEQKDNPKANPALLEAFYELKAKVAALRAEVSALPDSLPPEELRVEAVECRLLSGKPALVVDSYRSCDHRLDKQVGYHVVLAREPYNDGWHVVELHIMLYCTPANAEYVQPEFQQFLDSIMWLPPPL